MKNRRILVVAAHPDDEILGCGAATARHAAEGAVVWTLILAEGITSRAGLSEGQKQAQLKKLHAQARKANAAVGVKKLILRSFPDNRLDTVARLDVIQEIEAVIRELKPDTVYTHSSSDLNVDHQIVAESVRAACRPLPGSSVKRVLAFEVPSSTEWRFDASSAFHPNVFVDVTRHLAKKLAALRAYGGEMRPFPHPRSATYVSALAAVRGGQSGSRAAEAFCLIRETH